MHTNCILDSVANLLVRHMVFVGNVQKTPIASRLKSLDPSLLLLSRSSSHRHKGRYLLISLWKPFGLFVITFVLSGPISISYLVVVVSRRSTRTPTSSSSSESFCSGFQNKEMNNI